MAIDLKDLINPFVKSRAHYRMVEALRTGPKTGKELIEQHQISKSYKEIGKVAARLNGIHGVKVRVKGLADTADARWDMLISDPSCALLKQNLQQYATPQGPIVNVTIPKGPAKIGSYIPPDIYTFFRDSADEGGNIFLVGPSGSGKTEMAHHGAKDLGREFFRQNFNGETTVDNLIGYNEIVVSNGVSVTSWHDGVLAQAARMASKGKKVLYLADEVTAGKPEVLFQFHEVLEQRPDGSRRMEVNGERLTIPAGMLTIVGASNTFRADESGLFQGTNPMNQAFSNRWTGGVFVIDYAPNENEIMISHGIDPRVANALHSMAKLIREKAKHEGTPVVCSTRQLISIGKKAMRWGCRKALEYVYINTLVSDEYDRVVEPVISSMTWPK